MAITLCQAAHRQENKLDALVLEIGIDESGAMQQHVALGTPDVVLLTALGPEHLSGLGSWENAVAEELLLFRLRPEAVRIYQTADLKLAEAMARNLAPRACDWCVAEKGVPVAWGESQPLRRLIWEVEAENADSVTLKFSDGTGSTLGKIEIPLPGMHNAANAALAAAAALAVGTPWNEISSASARFQPPAMRSAIEHLPNGCVLVNDCYNASPASMEAALRMIESPEWSNKTKLLVLADMLDLGSESKDWHLKLVPQLAGRENTIVRLYGNAMRDVQVSLAAQTHLNVAHLGAADDPRKLLDGIPFTWSSGVVLVKGSRGMNLGRVVEEIRMRCRSA